MVIYNMKIKNNTKYSTLSLKKLFTRCVKEQEKLEGALPKWQKKNLYVTVKYSRSLNISGRAFYNGTRITMILPKQNINIISTAFVFLHELLHIRGYHHKAIYDATWRELANTFASQYTLDIKEEKPKEVRNIIDIRYQHVLSMVSLKEKAIKKIQNQLKKWTQKRKYYEKAIAAKNKE
jgi:hypothetical protein